MAAQGRGREADRERTEIRKSSPNIGKASKMNTAEGGNRHCRDREGREKGHDGKSSRRKEDGQNEGRCLSEIRRTKF